MLKSVKDEESTERELKIVPSSLLFDLNETQWKILHEFQYLVKMKLPEIPNNSVQYLAQWLMARDFDQTKAINMLQEHHNWLNRSFTAYMMKNRPTLELDSRMPVQFYGKTKDGHPIYYIILDNIDIQGLRRSIPYFDYLTARIRFSQKILDHLCELSKSSGNLVDQVYFIIDLNGFHLSDFVGDYRAISGTIDRIIASNYPENVAKIFIVNGYRIMSTLFGYFSYFLTQRLRSKFNVLGPNDLERIFEFIDKDQVPVYYGGSLIDPITCDSKCPSLIKWPEKYPPEMYKQGQWNSIDKSKFHHCFIGAGSSKTVLIGHTNEKIFLKWKLMSESHDIGFSLAYTPDPKIKNPELLEPSVRLNTQFVIERGQFLAKWPGTYYLFLDNTFSKLRGKNVYYEVSMDNKDDYKNVKIN